MAADPVEQDYLVKLASSDGIEFLVPRNMCALSGTLDNLCKNLCLDDAGTTNKEAIPLNNVDAETMRKVIVWMAHYANEPPPYANQQGRIQLNEYDIEYFNVQQGVVLQVILAANFLDIGALLDAGCQAVANSMDGLSVEQMRQRFNITNDFTREEEEALRNEDAWAD